MSLLGNIWVKLGLKSDDFNRGIDNAEKKTKTFGETMKGVAAKVTAVVAAFKMLAGTVKIISNFEAAQSRLASILGTSVDNMGRLTESAIELGRKTQYTASQVTDLQTELAKLGFVEPQILAMQESVLKFAAAVGTDLASAAARAGATMRGFGLTAEETGDMLNVMAVSTSKSALSFNYLDSTLGKLVPVAKSFGLSTEGTIALLGTLANAGIDASSAGTALRAIFIKLADSSSDLNKAMGGQPKTMEDLIKGFQKLRGGGLDLSEASDMVNDRFAAMLLTLANGADDVAGLYGELQNANGALDEMYETMTHNVKGAVEQVKSAWEGFVLSLRGSSGILFQVLSGVRDLINDLNYALFQSTKESTKTSEIYDELKRTIAETNDKEGALEIAYKKRLKEAETRVKEYEEQRALLDDLSKKGVITAGRFDNKAYKEAKAELVGLKNAYSQLKGELTQTANATATVTTATENENDAFAELVKQLGGVDKKHDGIIGKLREEIAAKKELLEDAKSEAEVRKINSEIAALQKKLEVLQQIRQYDYSSAGGKIATGLKGGMPSATVGIGIDTTPLQHSKEEVDKFIEDFKKQEALAEDIANGFGNALRNGVIDALDELATMIGTGDWDATALVKALVNPLADMAISVGTLVLSTGEAVESLKKALIDLFGGGPEGAVVAGAALIAVGVAAKAGLAAIAKSGGTASGAQTAYSYAGGYGIAPAMLAQGSGQVEIAGTVTVKGQDLQIALDNYNKNKGR